MARAIGLDIGADSIKVVELAGSAKAPKVQRVAIREIPPRPLDDPDYDHDAAVTKTIKAVFDELKLPKDDVCASFDSGVTVFREVTVPFFEDDQIRKVIRFEAENHLHNHAIDDVVVNWIKTGETRDGSRVMIFASPKVDLTKRLAMLRKAGVRPASIDLDTTALFTSMDTLGYFEEAPNVIVLDIGSNTTNLMMLADGKPRVMRSFLLGSGAVEQALIGELGVSRDESRRRMLEGAGVSSGNLMATAADLAEDDTEKSVGTLQKDAVAERRDHFVRKLHQEAIRSLLSVRSDSPPDRILLLGGGSLLADLPDQLSESFGLPVQRVDLGERIECKGSGASPEYTGAAIGSAVGCGLRMMGRNPLGVELLRDEYLPTNTFDVIKTPLCIAVTTIFLLMLGLTMIEQKKEKAARAEFNNWAWNANKMFLRVEPDYQHLVKGQALVKRNGKYEGPAYRMTRKWMDQAAGQPNAVVRVRTKLLQRHKELRDKLGLARDIKTLPSALEGWHEIYACLDALDRTKLGTWFQIEQFDLNETMFRCKIRLSDSVVQDTIKRALENCEYLKERARNPREVVQPGAEQPLQGGKVRVEYTVKFKEQ